MGCYKGSSVTISYSCSDVSIGYSAECICLPVWVHTHGYFAVPEEQIDGERYEFTFPGRYTEILLNGIPQLYTKTATGISLDKAPEIGDQLWGWWTL